MAENTPYGPDQLPWKDTLAPIAVLNDEYLVSPPSRDPNDLYDFPDEERGVTPKYYQVPSKGMTTDQTQRAQDETYYLSSHQTMNFLGYQVTLRNDNSLVSKYLTTMLNNVGDPFTPGSFTLNTKWMERNVLDYYASLWNAKWPHDPNDPESYWGYMLTMGSTEANLYASWNARDYLQGKFMLTDKREKYRVSYMRAKYFPNNNKNAFTPVAFYSEDTHYSLSKAMALLEINTFYQIGNTEYPGQCPLAGSNGDWPLEVPSLSTGSVDIDQLVQLVEFFAKKGYPPLIILNYGTTFKGAYDDVKTATDRIMPILTQYGLNERIITVTNPDDPSAEKKEVKRNGYWFHVDGALGAGYMPFLKMAFKKSLTNVNPPPDFDFKIPYLCSINTSGHKWPGAPWPCGIYMTKTGLRLLPPSDPEVIGSPDTTFGGSRNGLSALNWWTFISTNNYDSEVNKVVNCLRLVAYTYEELKKFPQDIWLKYSPLTLSIRFKKPNDEITYKYSLAVETITEEGKKCKYVHMYVMSHVTKELIDKLLTDLRSPDAWESEPEEKMKRKNKFGAGHDGDKEMPNLHDLVINGKSAGLIKGDVALME